MKRNFISLAVLLLMYVFSLLQIAAQDKNEYERYLAHIASAGALLQLNETGEAKHHLALAPAQYRDWEWHYLNTIADLSEKTLKGHSASVTALAINKQGTLLATGSADSTIRLWSFPDCRLLETLKGHKGQVNTLDFSPDGAMLASGSTDKTVKLWSVEQRKEIKSITDKLTQSVYCIKFHPDGKRLGVGTWNLTRQPFKIYGFALLFDIETGLSIRRYEGTSHPLSSLDFSDDGKTVVTGDWGFLIKQSGVDSGETLMELSIDDSNEYRAIQSVDLSPDGKTIIEGSKDNKIRLISSPDGTILSTIEPWRGHKKDVNAVAFSPDGSAFVSGSTDQMAYVWDSKTQQQLRVLRGHTAPITRTAYSPDGKYVITSSADSTIKIWKLDANYELTFDLCVSGPWSAPISPDGKLLAAGCSDKGIGIWNTKTGTKIGTLPDQAPNYCAFSSDSKFLVAGDHQPLIKLWNIEKMSEAKSFTGHTNSIFSVAIATKKNIIASGASDKTVRIWDIAEGKEEHQFTFENTSAFYVAFSPDESLLAAGTQNGMIRIWRTNDWQQVAEMKATTAVTGLEFSPDGSMLLAGGNSGTCSLWDMKSFSLLHSLNGHTNTTYGISFHTNGKRVVTASYDQTIKLWDTTTGRNVLTIRGGENEYYCASFFDEGKKLFVSQTNGDARILSIGNTAR